MKRVLFAFTGVVAAVFIMAIGGVDNVARSQSSLPAPTGVSAVNGGNPGEADLSWDGGRHVLPHWVDGRRGLPANAQRAERGMDE